MLFTNVQNLEPVKIQGIYSITQLINGKTYVGQSKNIYKRWREHLVAWGKPPSTSKLHKAFRKYRNPESWEFRILEIVDDPLTLSNRETFWIQTLDSFSGGYNSTPIGGTTRDYKLSEETKRKLSLRAQGRVVSQETRELLSVRLKGRPFSKQHRERLKEAWKGRKESAEWDPYCLANSQKDKDHHGEMNNFFGKRHREDSKERMSQSLREHFSAHPCSDELRNKRSKNVLGSKLMTNLEGEVVRVAAGDIADRLTQGWILGRLPVS
jgi:group I intron endonuclease